VAALENPPENVCFGCGPNHPRGFRWAVEDGTSPTGAPEVRLHLGFHFFALYEVSYWAALTLTGRVHRSVGAATFEQLRLPRVGVAHLARAELAERTEAGLVVRANTESLTGRPCGALRTTWIPARRAEVDRAGLLVPDYLRREMDP
jgi:hypothetical protein